jgi:hypothetical protein
MRSVIHILAMVALLISGCSSPDQAPTSPSPVGLSAEQAALLRSWFGNDSSPEGALRVAQICATHSLTRAEIVDFIGAPSHHMTREASLAYGFMPSELLEFYFDEDGSLKESRCMRERFFPKKERRKSPTTK